MFRQSMISAEVHANEYGNRPGFLVGKHKQDVQSLLQIRGKKCQPAFTERRLAVQKRRVCKQNFFDNPLPWLGRKVSIHVMLKQRLQFWFTSGIPVCSSRDASPVQHHQRIWNFGPRRERLKVRKLSRQTQGRCRQQDQRCRNQRLQHGATPGNNDFENRWCAVHGIQLCLVRQGPLNLRFIESIC